MERISRKTPGRRTLLRIRTNRILLRVVCVLVPLLGRESSAFSQARVVAIGDVHGAYPEFVPILQRAGLIDGDRNWVGGSAVLVQTGDVPGRGSATRQCLDLLIHLEQHAEKQNGKVVSKQTNRLGAPPPVRL